MYLGEQLTYVRTLKKMERKEIADKLGISLQQYTNYENNKSQIDEQRLGEISVILGMEKENIKEIDTQRILHQINNDNSTGYNAVTIHHHDPAIISEIIETQTKAVNMLINLVEMMDKRLSDIEQKTHKDK